MNNDPSFAAAQSHPEWMAVLQAYSNSVKAPGNDGWSARLTEIEGVAREGLSAIHGKLIAFGYLKFELVGRDAGIRYQLSSDGLQALNGPTIANFAEISEEAA